MDTNQERSFSFSIWLKVRRLRRHDFTHCVGIGMIGAAFYPKPVIVRFSDFKTNEYANLLGGKKVVHPGGNRYRRNF